MLFLILDGSVGERGWLTIGRIVRHPKVDRSSIVGPGQVVLLQRVISGLRCACLRNRQLLFRNSRAVRLDRARDSSLGSNCTQGVRLSSKAKVYF